MKPLLLADNTNGLFMPFGGQEARYLNILYHFWQFCRWKIGFSFFNLKLLKKPKKGVAPLLRQSGGRGPKKFSGGNAPRPPLGNHSDFSLDPPLPTTTIWFCSVNPRRINHELARNTRKSDQMMNMISRNSSF